MERHFLELLQFNINVPSSVYAKYYFDLRSLSESNNLSGPLELLSRDKAQKLEVGNHHSSSTLFFPLFIYFIFVSMYLWTSIWAKVTMLIISV